MNVTHTPSGIELAPTPYSLKGNKYGHTQKKIYLFLLF